MSQVGYLVIELERHIFYVTCVFHCVLSTAQGLVVLKNCYSDLILKEHVRKIFYKI